MAGNKERKGIIEGYKNLNKLTRNGALLLTPVFAVTGYGGLALAALASAGVDHLQYKGAEWWQNRKTKSVTMKQDVWYTMPKTA